MSFYDTAVKLGTSFVKLYHRLEVDGLENVPDGGFVLAPNHTHWSGWDAFVFSVALRGRRIRWVSWSYGEENPLWDRLAASFDAILYNGETRFPYEEIVEDVLKRGDVVGVFPEGNNNTVRTPYRLRRFLPGCVRLAALADAPIVPAASAGLEEASPILWAKENVGEPVTHLVAPPVLFPTKVSVAFGAPMRPALTAADLGDRARLDAEADKVRMEVLSMLKRFRPKAWAE